MSLFKEKKSKVRITGKNNTIIINGKRISGDFKDCIKSHFDEKKVESAKNIDSITIVSDCFVKISTSNSSDIEVHFYGDAQIKGDVKFKVTKMGDELKITLKLDGMLQIADLNLEISIPKDKKLKKLFVETTSDDVVFTDSLIYSDCLKVITASGDTNIKGKFDFIGIESTSGDIIVETKSVDCLELKKFQEM